MSSRYFGCGFCFVSLPSQFFRIVAKTGTEQNGMNGTIGIAKKFTHCGMTAEISVPIV